MEVFTYMQSFQAEKRSGVMNKLKVEMYDLSIVFCIIYNYVWLCIICEAWLSNKPVMSGRVGMCNWIHSDLSGRFFQDPHCKWMRFCKFSRPALPAFLSPTWCLGLCHDLATDLAWQDLTSSDMNRESLLEACAAAANVYWLDTSWAQCARAWSKILIQRLLRLMYFLSFRAILSYSPPFYFDQMLATRAYVDEFEATETGTEQVLWFVTVV